MTGSLTADSLRVLQTLDLPEVPGAQKLAILLPDAVLGGYFWRGGARPRLVVLHGWGGDAHAMRLPAERFAAAGWTVLSLSMRGWRGSSGCDDYGRTGPQDLRTVLSWLNEITDSRQPLVLLGFSMGGMMALLTATTQPTPLTHVVSVSAPTDFRRVYQTTSYGGLRRYYDAVFTAQQWHAGSPLTHAHALRVPALIVVGSNDRFCPPEEGRSYATAAQATLLELPGMAHEPAPEHWETIFGAVQGLVGEP